MSLPKHFDSPEAYFEECLNFLREYQYFYNHPNTDILIHNILDKIAIEDENIDVFGEDFDLTAIDDKYLNTFFSRLKRLQVFYDIREYSLDDDVNVPASVKKKHEIIYLAKEIQEVCKEVDCQVVVDFGSGLGYLDQLLFEKSKYNILGIECNESHYVGAKTRQRKYHSNSINNVKYIRHTITQDSDTKIREYVHEKFENHRQFCITGLHACADLTIDAIHLFLKMADAKALVIMPCCYHKMVENSGVFTNFPLSNSLRDIFGRFQGETYMRVPFLRLATQPPTVGEKLEDLVFNLLSRAVLQEFAMKHNCKLKRNKRKAVKTKTMNNNFETYIQDATTTGFTLIKNDSSNYSNKSESPTFSIEEVKTLWNDISQMTYKKAGIFILLQNALQPVLENLILFDRIVYLKENSVNNCEFRKILNVNMSPRSLALVACK